MIMKTSVLLSWEFPDNYNSPTPYKVRPRAGAGQALERGQGRGLSGIGLHGGLRLRLELGFTLRLGLKVGAPLGLKLNLGLGLSKDWGSAQGQSSAGI